MTVRNGKEGKSWQVFSRCNLAQNPEMAVREREEVGMTPTFLVND